MSVRKQWEKNAKVTFPISSCALAAGGQLVWNLGQGLRLCRSLHPITRADRVEQSWFLNTWVRSQASLPTPWELWAFGAFPGSGPLWKPGRSCGTLRIQDQAAIKWSIPAQCYTMQEIVPKHASMPKQEKKSHVSQRKLFLIVETRLTWMKRSSNNTRQNTAM